MALGLILGGLGVASNLLGMAGASRDRRTAEGRLRELQKQPWARYQFDPALAGLASQATSEAAAPMGYSGAERSAFNQNLARTQSAQLARGTSMGGGSSSRAINAVLGANTAGALNTFSQNDAALRRSNRLSALNRASSLYGQRQNISNMNTSQDIRYRDALERAYGSAIQRNSDYIRGTISNLGSDLIRGGLMGETYGAFDKIDKKLGNLFKGRLDKGLTDTIPTINNVLPNPWRGAPRVNYNRWE